MNGQETRHRQFVEVLQWLEAKVPVWLWGAPGAGKTHLAEQLAEAMQLTFYPIYLGPTTTESKILGFKNASLGEYIKGLAVDAYVHGGLLYLDEIDNCDASVLVAANALLSNRTYRFPDGMICTRHERFTVLAGANTLGTGSTSGFKRNAQDAASRSRFAKVQFFYDEELEMTLSAGQPEWCMYVQKVRKYVQSLAKCNLWITSRDVMYGAWALNRGIDPGRVCNSTIFAEMQPDVKTLVLRHCGTYPPPAKVAFSIHPDTVKAAISAEVDADLSTAAGLPGTPWADKKKNLSEKQGTEYQSKLTELLQKFPPGGGEKTKIPLISANEL